MGRQIVRRLSTYDWRKSPAHLYFLSLFLSPKTLADLPKQDWGLALGEPINGAIKRFLRDGVIGQANLPALLDYRYRAFELKQMLKDRRLPVSGQKQKLIDRLIEAAPSEMEELVKGISALNCTEQGKAIAKEYLSAREPHRENKYHEKIFNLIKQRKFKEVVYLIDKERKEKQKVEYNDELIGVSFNISNPKMDLKIIKEIFDKKPKIVEGINDEQLEWLRISAAMMQLSGTNRANMWLPQDFQLGLHFDEDTAARMVLFCGMHYAQLDQWRNMGLRIISIDVENDACEMCQKLRDIEFDIDQVPELPHEKCISKKGCRCKGRFSEQEFLEKATELDIDVD